MNRTLLKQNLNPSSGGRLLEALLCVLTSAWLIFQCVPEIHHYATSSLWTDEIYSVTAFTSQGFIHCLTDWHAPNNHMLFNALNSLFPGADSLNPLRMRLLSMVFVALALAIAFVAHGRKGHWLTALLVCWVLIGSDAMLDVSFTARGYGLLNLFALIFCLLVPLYTATWKPVYLVLLSLTVVLGSWTVTSFVFFGGPVLLFLFLLKRNWQTLIAGGATLAAILAIYVPPYLKVLKRPEFQDNFFPGQFHELAAPLKAIASFFPMGNNLLVAGILLAGMAVFPVLFWYLQRESSSGNKGPAETTRQDHAEFLSMALLAAGVLSAYAIALILKRPLFRTTAYLLIPLTIVWGESLFRLLRAVRWKPALVRAAVTLAFVTAIVFQTHARTQGRRLLPIEAWGEMVDVLERLNLLEKPYYGVGRPDTLYLHFPGAPPETIPQLDESAFQSGKLVVVDSGPPPEDGSRFEGRKITGRAVDLTVPQLRWEYQRISFVPPDRQGVADLSVREKPGTDSHRTFEVHATLTPGKAGCGHLFLYSPNNDSRKPPKVKWLTMAGTWRTLKDERIHSVTEELWELDLTELNGASESGVTELTFSYYIRAPMPDGPALKVWCPEEE